MKIHRLITLVFAALLISVSVMPSSAAAVPVVYDSGNGAKYDALPVNYAQIKDLDLAHAVIESGSGYSIEKGYTTKSDKYDDLLLWTGKLPSGFGSSNPTNDHAASLKKNVLPDVTLRFPGGAALSDGKSCDVRLTLSSITVNIGASLVDSITDSTKLKIHIGTGWGCLSVSCPKTTFSIKDNTPSGTGKNSGATIATRLKATIQLVNKGTNTPIDQTKYPTMLIEFKDLDTRDHTGKKSLTSTQEFNGVYAEAVEMTGSGWVGSAVLGPKTNDLANTRLVKAITTDAGNTKIKPDGEVLSQFIEKYDPPSGDGNTLWSGFVAAVKPQGFSFYWTGSILGGKNNMTSMGTSIGGQPTVAVKAQRHNPGASGASLGGTGTKSGVDQWYTNTHLMNSSAVYSYKPASGWRVKSLKVDGKTQTLTETQKLNGGSYTFKKLNKYPLPERDMRTGEILASSGSGFYTIETDYERIPEYRDSKKSDTPYIDTYSDKIITYQIRADELVENAGAGSHRIHDDLAGGLLTLEGEPEVRTQGGRYVKNKADSTGLDYTFNSDAATSSKPYMIITYKARVNWDAYFASDKTSIINTVTNNDPDPGDPPSTETLVRSDLRITKTVEGKLRDTSKQFEFDVVLSGLDSEQTYLITPPDKDNRGLGELGMVMQGSSPPEGQTGIVADSDGNASFRFKAKGGEGIVIKWLPVGAKYKITEAASDHKASYAQTSDEGDPVFVKKGSSNITDWKAISTEEETIDKQDGNITVAFTNRRDPAVITGITTGGDWPVALTACAVLTAAAVLMAVRRLFSRKAAHHGD